MGGLLPYGGNNNNLRLSSRDIEATKRHDELLNAIRENNWHASRHKDVAAFSEKLGSQAAMELETRFRKMILARLHFQHMPDRAESIPIAYTNTFGWLFENATSADGGDDHDDDEGHWSCFSDWLKERDSSIYWITGKPGSYGLIDSLGWGSEHYQGRILFLELRKRYTNVTSRLAANTSVQLPF
jgi:hypothetical protein